MVIWYRRHRTAGLRLSLGTGPADGSLSVSVSQEPDGDVEDLCARAAAVAEKIVQNIN